MLVTEFNKFSSLGVLKAGEVVLFNNTAVAFCARAVPFDHVSGLNRFIKARVQVAFVVGTSKLHIYE